jgi:UPF0716 family protein affecting phage T7 exclusion
MQHQQKKDLGTKPRPHRSVGEFLAGWLLLLWGLVSTWTGFMLLNTFDIGHWSPRTLLLHGLCCLTGGGLTLLQLPRLAAWLFWGASVTTLILGVLFVWNEPSSWVPRWRLELSSANLLSAFVCLTIASLLLLLGRWLSRLKDIET